MCEQSLRWSVQQFGQTFWSTLLIRPACPPRTTGAPFGGTASPASSARTGASLLPSLTARHRTRAAGCCATTHNAPPCSPLLPSRPRSAPSRPVPPAVRGRPGAGAAQGAVRPLCTAAGLQLPLPLHHPGVQHLLHHRAARPGGREGARGGGGRRGGEEGGREGGRGQVEDGWRKVRAGAQGGREDREQGTAGGRGVRGRLLQSLAGCMPLRLRVPVHACLRSLPAPDRRRPRAALPPPRLLAAQDGGVPPLPEGGGRAGAPAARHPRPGAATAHCQGAAQERKGPGEWWRDRRREGRAGEGRAGVPGWRRGGSCVGGWGWRVC